MTTADKGRAGPEVGTGYPPAPWRMRGELWGGFFAAAAAPVLPGDVSPLASRSLVALLIRYREGTLSYDEFILGSLVRRGRRAGVYVHVIRVDDSQAMWGGRRIWGVPKEHAEFDWSGSQVRITDEQGPLATLTTTSGGLRLPALPMPLAGFGALDGTRTFFSARFRTRTATATMSADEWSVRLPALRRSSAYCCFSGAPFTISLPAPVLLQGRSA
ncbi:acetoacetate decarboxylase family protein [Streptomyces monticola]|uniref:Acetoacetate decarboxylase family protein n=1 Tax=Streptomyces monticola TaxID=2666263 RepID=A0ABW2JSV2_9ACTN